MPLNEIEIKEEFDKNDISHKELHTRINAKIGVKTVLSLIGTLILIVGIGIKYTYSQSEANAEEHKELATEVDMKEADEKLDEKLDKLDIRLNGMQDMQQIILNAVRDNKER